jgi:hypothetical protein
MREEVALKINLPESRVQVKEKHFRGKTSSKYIPTKKVFLISLILWNLVFYRLMFKAFLISCCCQTQHSNILISNTGHLCEKYSKTII